MVKNVCQIYLKGLKEFHFKLFLALALASGASRPHLEVSEHPLNPQFQGLKIDLCSYHCPNYFSRSAPGNLFSIWWASNRSIPVALNPESKLDDFILPINFCRGSFSLHLHLHVSNISLHSIFTGQETATSSGWHWCLVFGGRQMKITPCSKQALITLIEKCDSRFSSVKMTFFPLWWHIDGRNCLECIGIKPPI